MAETRSALSSRNNHCRRSIVTAKTIRKIRDSNSMSSVSTPTTLWSGTKTINVTGHTRHRHNPSPVAPQFTAPTVASTLSFGPIALAAAIGRTATLQGAPTEMAVRWRDNALSDVEFLIEDGTTFSLSPNLKFLADVERTVFAARVGAGITDLVMNALGYIWRDNAAQLSSSVSLRLGCVKSPRRVG